MYTFNNVLLSIVLFLTFLSGYEVAAQTVIDAFDPNPNGAVRIVVVQPDGKILIGGEFTTVAPNGGPTVTRNYIARLNIDGSLDADFNPSANNFVLALALQADGKVLAGGPFSTIGGQTRSSLARLDPVTGVADSFDPSPNFFVQGLAVQTDGKIVAGGAFTTIGGQNRNMIARLDPVTGLADSFNPNSNGIIRAIIVQNDGEILFCGEFSSVGGQTRRNIARVDPNSGLADSFNPNANDYVRSIAVQLDGKVIAGGGFTSIGGQSRNSLARLDPATGAADSLNPNANNAIRAVAVQADGKIIAGGDFTFIGGQTRNYIARVDGVTGQADSFNPNAIGFSSMRTMAIQNNGAILVGGVFNSFAPDGGTSVTRRGFVRFGSASQPVELSGRVTTPNGIALRNAQVSLTDAQGVKRFVTTSSFGIYSFTNVATGPSYTITVSSKRYRFAPKTITISTNVTGVDFVGLE